MILPSYREGFSQSLVEALAMGCPIITTDVPGCREMIDGNGFLVAPQNIKELKNAMNKMLQSNAGLKDMSRRSENMAKRFDVKIINQQIKKLSFLRAFFISSTKVDSREILSLISVKLKSDTTN